MFSASARTGSLLAPEHKPKSVGEKVLLPFFVQSVPVSTTKIPSE